MNNLTVKIILILLTSLVTLSCETSHQSEEAFFECVKENLNAIEGYNYNDFIDTMNAVEVAVLEFQKASSIDNKVALNFVESLNNPTRFDDVKTKFQQDSFQDYTVHNGTTYYDIKSCVIEIAELHSLKHSELLKSHLKLHNIVGYNSTLEIVNLIEFVESIDLMEQNDQILFYYWVYMYIANKQIDS